jgi:hypothetical protein
VRLGITVYDSLYVTLALREGCKLATFDEKLRAQLAAKGAGRSGAALGLAAPFGCSARSSYFAVL